MTLAMPACLDINGFSCAVGCVSGDVTWIIGKKADVIALEIDREALGDQVERSLGHTVAIITTSKAAFSVELELPTLDEICITKALPLAAAV